MNIKKTSFAGLVGDIGATNARFALVESDGQTLKHTTTLPTGLFSNLTEAVQAYLDQVGEKAPSHACIAIANPVDGDWLRMTNTSWAFSVALTRVNLGLETLHMLNDWEAIALLVPSIAPHELMPLGRGESIPHAPRGLIGAGSGLGVSSLVRSSTGEWVPIAGEGGHVTLCAGNPEEADLLRLLWKRWPHVSAERVISGMGLENLHAVLVEMSGMHTPRLQAAEISRLALTHQDALCEKAVDMLCVFLGRIAGNLALTLGARGGIYISGGVMHHLRPFLHQSGFRAAFEDKGRFSEYLQKIPTYLIEAEEPGLRGAAVGLKMHSGQAVPNIPKPNSLSTLTA